MNKATKILALAEFGKRFFDKDSPKTTLSTISGTTLIGIGSVMLNSPEMHMVAMGTVICAAGVGLMWYKEYKGSSDVGTTEASEETDKSE